MKKLMRILAMLVCAAMLLSASAMAAAGLEFTLNDIVMSMGEGMSLDLSGVGLNLGFAEKDGGVGLHLGLSAEGERVADIRACVQGDKLLIGADGISNVYSLDLAQIVGQAGIQAPKQGFTLTEKDQEALMAIAQEAMMVFYTSVTMTEAEDGTMALNVDISEESVDSVLAALAVLLDSHPELFAESEYSNFSEMLADMDAKISIKGEAVMAENALSGMLYLNARDVESDYIEALAIKLDYAMDADAETGTDAVVVSVALGELDVDGAFEADALIEAVVLTMNGEFASFELTFAEAGDDEEGLAIMLASPLVMEDGGWSFAMMALDESAALNANIYESAGEISLYADEDAISFSYASENEQMQYLLEIAADGEVITVAANGTIDDADAAWMIPAGTQSIDIMTISEDQTNALMMEAMSVAMGALSSLAQANATIATLVNQMMG